MLGLSISSVIWWMGAAGTFAAYYLVSVLDSKMGAYKFPNNVQLWAYFALGFFAVLVWAATAILAGVDCMGWRRHARGRASGGRAAAASKAGKGAAGDAQMRAYSGSAGAPGTYDPALSPGGTPTTAMAAAAAAAMAADHYSSLEEGAYSSDLSRKHSYSST